MFVRRPLAQPPVHYLGPSAPVSWVPLKDARAALVGAARLELEREDAQETVVRLVSGTALFHVRKGAGRHFVVEAGRRRVEVMGTIFGVARDGDGAHVEVMEGVVRSSEDGSSELLRAGESSPAGSGLFRLAVGALAELRAPVPADSSVPLRASAAVSPAPSSSVVPGVPVAALPLETRVSAPHPQPLSPARSGAASAGASAPSAGESGYLAARALERSGKVAEAASAYRALARGGGGDADDAAFALARLSSDHDGPNAVLAAVDAYRQAFPTGRYAREIDVLELNAHLARSDRRAALRDAEVFLLRFPNDVRAWRFRLVRAGEEARLGNCEAAVRELDTVPEGADKAAALAGCGGR
jgi:transmembrane sensor